MTCSFPKLAKADLNYEVNSTWPIVLRCTDSGDFPEFKDQKFIVSVLDVNESPTAIEMSGGTIKEKEAAGQLVAKFSTSDPDNEIKITQVSDYKIHLLY